MAYGTTPTGSDTVPLSSGLVPGTTNMIPISGANVYTDSNGNQYTILVVEDIEPAGYVSLTSPPSTTTASTDTPFTFASQVNHVILQNNTSANVWFAFDTVATIGSLLLVPGSMLIYAKKVSVVHLYTVAATNVNGTAAGNIVLLGAQ